MAGKPNCFGFTVLCASLLAGLALATPHGFAQDSVGQGSDEGPVYNVRPSDPGAAVAPGAQIETFLPHQYPQLPEAEEITERDMFFAFVTPLSPFDSPALAQGDNAPKALEDGDLLSGGDILSRLAERDAPKEQNNLTEDKPLTAYFQHPASGKSVELQLAHCDSLNYETGEPPFAQQVRCGADLFSYRAGPHGIEVLRNGELYFDMPLDPGLYRLNGSEIVIKE